MIRNNVTRLLDSHKVKYTAYKLPPQKLGAQEVAEFLDVPLAQVYKTIVLLRKGAGKPVLVVVPGNAEVDTKAVARSVGTKKIIVATQREAEQLTGLKVGGISPLALINKGFQVLVDQSALNYEAIHISGGQLGLNIGLPAHALINLTNARVAVFARF